MGFNSGVFLLSHFRRGWVLFGGAFCGAFFSQARFYCTAFFWACSHLCLAILFARVPKQPTLLLLFPFLKIFESLPLLLLAVFLDDLTFRQFLHFSVPTIHFLLIGQIVDHRPFVPLVHFASQLLCDGNGGGVFPGQFVVVFSLLRRSKHDWGCIFIGPENSSYVPPSFRLSAQLVVFFFFFCDIPLQLT